jgi:hypothetical protein
MLPVTIYISDIITQDVGQSSTLIGLGVVDEDDSIRALKSSSAQL